MAQVQWLTYHAALALPRILAPAPPRKVKKLPVHVKAACS